MPAFSIFNGSGRKCLEEPKVANGTVTAEYWGARINVGLVLAYGHIEIGSELPNSNWVRFGKKVGLFVIRHSQFFEVRRRLVRV